MRFMMMVKSNAQAEAGIMPEEKLLTEMGKYNEELIKSGALLGGEGLLASSKGARVRLSGGQLRVIDGPFTEAKELVAGYWLIQAKSKAEAVDWARRVPHVDGEIEVRPLFELEDFPADPAEKPDGWREQERQLRDATPAAAPAGGLRFMTFLKADKKTEAGALPSEELLTAMGALMQDLAKAGALVSGEGLKPSAEGAKVLFSGSKRTVVDGPFTEAKELIAGYSVLRVRSLAEAIAWSKRFLTVHVEGSGVGEGEVEIRQIFELTDIPVDAAEKADGWRKREQEMRDRMGKG